MDRKLKFIDENDFTKFVHDTVVSYAEKLQSFDLKRFRQSPVDPIQMIFDRAVYGLTWKELIGAEIYRQRKLLLQNEMNYFHKNIFRYIKNCRIPENGEEYGWDVIWESPEEIILAENTCVHKVYVKIIERYDVINSVEARKLFIRMQDCLLKEKDCACFLVEIASDNSHDTEWEMTCEGNTFRNGRIRRVSLDQFYALVTGEKDAFYQMCMVLPEVIQRVVDSEGENLVPYDRVYDELKAVAGRIPISDEKLAFAMAIYMLGFSSYYRFTKIMPKKALKDLALNEEISEYGKQIFFSDDEEE